MVHWPARQLTSAATLAVFSRPLQSSNSISVRKGPFMNNSLGTVSMSQRIFSMNLAVETVSLYLLCCALADAGTPINHETVGARWNGSDAELERQLTALEKRNIIRRSDAPTASLVTYQLVADRAWR
jgi:hypothetical protein